MDAILDYYQTSQ